MKYNPFSRLNAAMRELGGSIKRALYKFQEPDDAADLSKSALPIVVKAMIPRSVFTKRMTRSRAKELRRALSRMTPAQREVAHARGWAR